MFKSHRIGPKGQEYFSLFISASLALADILLGMVVVPFSLVQVCSISMKKIVKRLGLGLAHIVNRRVHHQMIFAMSNFSSSLQMAAALKLPVSAYWSIEC